jgi:deoxyribonuclease V
LGLFLDLSTIGCAKSILCGRHQPVGEETGSHVELLDNGELIGAALRTKSGVKPVYVSVGHKIALTSALQWVIKCCRGYRIPEPTRLAHLAAAGSLVFEPDYQRGYLISSLSSSRQGRILLLTEYKEQKCKRRRKI